MSDEIGKKFDNGKTDWTLFLWREAEQVVRVLMLGATKYGRENFKNVPDARNRYAAAAVRHLVAWMSGDPADKESGLSHLAHLCCCALFLMWFDNEGRDK